MMRVCACVDVGLDSSWLAIQSVTCHAFFSGSRPRSLRSLRSAPGTVEESSSAESEEDDSQDDDAEAPGFETGAWIFGCEISNRGCHVVGQGQDTFKKCVGVCFREFVVIYYIYIYIIDIQLVDVPFLWWSVMIPGTSHVLLVYFVSLNLHETTLFQRIYPKWWGS